MFKVSCFYQKVHNCFAMPPHYIDDLKSKVATLHDQWNKGVIPSLLALA